MNWFLGVESYQRILRESMPWLHLCLTKIVLWPRRWLPFWGLQRRSDVVEFLGGEKREAGHGKAT